MASSVQLGGVRGKVLSAQSTKTWVKHSPGWPARPPPSLTALGAACPTPLQGRRFAFSLLVHNDTHSAMFDFLASSSVLQVGGQGAPSMLMPLFV